MAKSLSFLSFATSLTVFCVATAAQAATIDLTDASVGSKVNGLNTKTLKIDDAEGTGVDVTITASGGYLSHQTGDGLGVNNGSNDINCYNCEIIPDDWASTKDEIDQAEKITVRFSEAVQLLSIGLTDLYASPESGSWAWIPDETGEWSLYNGNTLIAKDDFAGTQQRIESNGSTTNGEYSVDIGGLLATAVALISTNEMWGYKDGSPYKGFSLASVTFNPVGVPELSGAGAKSAFALLIGVGLIFADRRRRQPAISFG